MNSDELSDAMFGGLIPGQKNKEWVMRRHHDLKIWPVYFDVVDSGEKTFEFRSDDRGFKSGDTCTLKEWDPSLRDYTGREASFEIGFVLPTQYFSNDGVPMVIFSLLPGAV